MEFASREANLGGGHSFLSLSPWEESRRDWNIVDWDFKSELNQSSKRIVSKVICGSMSH